MIDPWNELLEAARDFHSRIAHHCGSCRLAAALSRFAATPTLFDPPIPDPFDPEALDRNELGGFRATDPATSRKSAVSVYPRSGTQRYRAFASILATGERGATVSELIETTGLPHQTISTRVSELKRGGWVEPRGERTGDFGTAQTVHVATAKAREAFASQLEAA